MLFQPAIIALLLAASLAAVIFVGAAPLAIRIIRQWDLASGSERQLALERQTYLFSTLIQFVLWSQLAALLLFVFNADRLSVMFVGAMCAVGTLKVNSWGFPSLTLQIILFFAASSWLVINHVDQQARDYPLIRIKYALLLALTPLVLANLWLEWEYFTHLKANIITSCCGSLFSGDSASLSTEIASLPPRYAIGLFYASMAAAILSNVWQARAPSAMRAYLSTTASLAGFLSTLIGLLSFISLYIYEHPHHHCPFCILKPEYHYLGYALYAPLFLATACGLGIGAIQPFARHASLSIPLSEIQRRLALWSAGHFALLAILVSAFIAQSRLILLAD